MPVIEIKFKDIVFNPNVQTYCISPKFKCPNYNHSWACPPQAPYMEGEISRYDKFFLIFYKFNLSNQINTHKHFSLNERIRDYLENEIIDFIKNYKRPYQDKLILWDGYCRICFKKGKKCTYDENEPCRYPDHIRYSMEAVGIDVGETVKNYNLPLEWPPVNHIYRFGLVCLK